MSLFKNKNKDKFISFNGKRYVINFERLKEVCLTSSSEFGTKEMEITQVYEPDPLDGFAISSRVEHETKVNKTPQNDMIIYDIVKLLIISILENNTAEDEFKYDFSTAFALNTLLSWGVVEELSEKEEE